MELAVDSAFADARLLGSIARGFYRPDACFCADVRSGSYFREFDTLFPSFGESVAGGVFSLFDDFSFQIAGLPLEDLRLVLETDYNHLFVGPGQVAAPPYESFYLSAQQSGRRGILRGRFERCVTDYYSDHGFRLADGSEFFSDHLAVELEFLSQLSLREARYLQQGLDEDADLLRNVGDRFCREHLSLWLPLFADRVDKEARTSFYRALARLCLGFVNVGDASDEGR
ncbi:MAG: molecular chaperone TorD family protein [Berryella intestinalis]|uniref:TorD/DmsD family molecular chaperone n=1 Tax=Berryella intestinalis TaxID=1531429 RepID=UPI002A536BB3|nr:molecular chaperone TorD family protein [Berryella intestinalis]MDD7369571.1 molecular chaperone TorD family protein [Berryella intestinalis]MDY3129043.1 molecular chaperone TorD family protein [Berryella intestinalis]